MRYLVVLGLVACFFNPTYAESNLMDTVYGVVLAGGSGERLWPLSRKNKPKQLLCLDSEKTLLDQSITRLRTVDTIGSVYIASAQGYMPLLADMVGRTVDGIITEPVALNTGPAILYACFELYKKNIDAVVIFAPADAFIPEADTELFCHSVERMVSFVRSHDSLAILGVRPRYAATGYGYIQYDETDLQDALYRVSCFHEKPSSELAARYLNQRNMLWNIGMFGGKVSVFIEEFRKHAPDMVQAMEAYMSGDDSYDAIPSQAIDYAVIEKSSRVRVLSVDFSWCDVGNLETFLLKKYPQNNVERCVVEVNAKNNLTDVPKKLVALIGVDDICVVETDDTLLIAKRSEVEMVRDVVALLKKHNMTVYL